MNPNARAGLLLAAALFAGCSESEERFSALARHGTATGGRHAATGGGTGTGGASTGGAPETGGRSGIPDAGTDADASAGDSGSSGGSGGKDAGPDGAHADDGPGALVGYDIRSTEKKLYVLDPETGRALSSESIGTVRAIVNDGARYPDDVWYVFEQEPPPSRGVTIHARHLDFRSGVLRQVGLLTNAPMIYGRAAAFSSGSRSLVAYLSDFASDTSSKADLALVVLDMTDPTRPTILPVAGSLPSGPKLGVVLDGDSVNVVVVQRVPCPTGSSGRQECTVSLVRAVVTATAVQIDSTTTVDKIGPGDNVEFALDSLRHEIAIGFPPVSPPANPACGASSRSTGKVQSFSVGATTPGPSVAIPVETPLFAGAAFDACSRTMFLSSLAGDSAIWAARAGTASVTKQCAGTTGGPLLFEPSSRTLFRALASGGIEAHRVDTSGTEPKLTARTLEELPAGAHFGALAVRSPQNPTCP